MDTKNKTCLTMSFRHGFALLNDFEKEACKKEIMEGLNIKTNQGWLKRLRGDVNHTVIDAKLIECAFSKQGVKARDVWG